MALALSGCVADIGQGPGTPRSPGSALVERMRFPPLTLRVPGVGREVERRVLPNGLVLYLADDRTLPMFQAHAIVRAGSLYEDPGRPAAALFTGSQLRDGGTASRSFRALNEELDHLGASVETTVSAEEISVSLSALAKDADLALALFADLLRRPAFDPAPLETAKGRSIEELRRLAESPGRLAAREFSRALYTEAHPLGRPLTAARVAALQRDDLVRHHRRFFVPNNLFLAVVGDFSRQELAAKVQTAFGDWARDPSFGLPPVPPVRTQVERGVRLLPRDIDQASIILGHFGTTRGNPDRYPIELMDALLGAGGFTSRLMERLRAVEGMTYGAWSSFPTTTSQVSLFRAGLQTRNENVPRAVAAILEEMRRLQDAPVPAAELALAKEAIANSFVFRFTSRFATVTRLLMLEAAGEPADTYDRLLERIQGVTPADIQRVARQYLHPDRALVLVVGRPEAFEAGLSPFGPLQRISADSR